MEYFNYVIARKWNEGENNLCCYTYGSTVFYCTMEEANDMLKFIRNRVDEHSNEYEIYKIENKPLKQIVMESDKYDKIMTS